MKKIEYLKIIYALAILAAFCTGLYFIFSIPDTDVTEVSEEYVVIPTTYATVEDAVKAEAYAYYEQQEKATQEETTTARVEIAETEAVGVYMESINKPDSSDLISEEEMDLLLRCVEAEAGNQSLEGRQLVTDVILNRVRNEKWPDTITGVITKKYEFSSYWDGAMDRVTVSDLTRRAVELELEEIGYPGLYYFTAGKYNDYGTPWKKVGDHYFSTK